MKYYQQKKNYLWNWYLAPLEHCQTQKNTGKMHFRLFKFWTPLVSQRMPHHRHAINIGTHWCTENATPNASTETPSVFCPIVFAYYIIMQLLLRQNTRQNAKDVIFFFKFYILQIVQKKCKSSRPWIKKKNAKYATCLPPRRVYGWGFLKNLGGGVDWLEKRASWLGGGYGPLQLKNSGENACTSEWLRLG